MDKQKKSVQLHPLKALCIAFARYSAIPMPYFEWEEADFGMSLLFFPWVGAVVGAAFFGVCAVLGYFRAPAASLPFFLAAVPLLLTGGFHLDGYMDTVDARASYKSREEKLAILKDPRTGAFAIIHMLKEASLFTASLFVILGEGGEDRPPAGLLPQAVLENILLLASMFFVSRCLCAWGVLYIVPARKEGMLFEEARTADRIKNLSSIWLALSLVASGAAICAKFGWMGATSLVACLLTYFWFSHMCKVEFGGITGDLAGYFVVICEVNAALAIGFFCLVF